MDQIPDRIYLQVYGEDRLFGDDSPLLLEDASEGEVTWCVEEIYNTDVAYVREDIVQQMIRSLERNIRDFDAIRRLASQGHGNGRAQLADVRSATRAAKRESEILLEELREKVT